MLLTLFPRPGQNGDDFMGMGGGTPGTVLYTYCIPVYVQANETFRFVHLQVRAVLTY
jgi:hypothetical protein